MSHVPNMNVFSAYQSHVTHMNASCHKYRLCLSKSWTSRLPYLNQPHLKECDLSHIKTKNWVMRHIWKWVMQYIQKNESCTTYVNESCTTNERFMKNIPQAHPSCSSCVCTFACVNVWMCSILLYVFEIPPQTVYCWVLSCHVLQCVAVYCSVFQCDVVCCSVMQCDAVWCSVMQCGAVCCSVLQCVAVCCSVIRFCSWAVLGAQRHILFVGVSSKGLSLSLMHNVEVYSRGQN